MPGLVPGIHDLNREKDVGGRDKPGHDDVDRSLLTFASFLPQRPQAAVSVARGTFAFAWTLMSRSPIENGPPRRRPGSNRRRERSFVRQRGLFAFALFDQRTTRASTGALRMRRNA